MFPTVVDMTKAALANEMFRHPLTAISDANMQMVAQTFTREDGGTGNEIHHRSSQLSTVISGRGTLRLLHGVTLTLGPGTTFRIPRRTEHDIIVDPDSVEPLRLATMYAPPLHAPPDKHIPRRVNDVEDEYFGPDDFEYRSGVPKPSYDDRRTALFMQFTGDESTWQENRPPVTPVDLNVAAILNTEEAAPVPELTDRNIETSVMSLTQPYVFPKEMFVSHRITIVAGSGAFRVDGDDNEIELGRGATFLLSPSAPTVAVRPLTASGLKLVVVHSPSSLQY